MCKRQHPPHGRGGGDEDGADGGIEGEGFEIPAAAGGAAAAGGVGYAIKKAGDSCFMMPETFDFIGEFAAEARALGIEVLVEIHSYFQRQIEIAARVDWVYDFALPPLVLHALFNGTAQPLKRWIGQRPHNALTVLDTHAGIGIIAIGAAAQHRSSKPGLCPLNPSSASPLPYPLTYLPYHSTL